TAQSWFGTVFSEELRLFLQEETEHETSSLLLGKDRSDGIRRMTLLELQGMTTWQERFSYILQNLFPPPKFMLWRYQEKKRIFLPYLYVRRLFEGLLIMLRR
ncbi:MAG: hypothetical protein D3908_13105, partial [Candidatus Electrothrix sp. AUS4]|nr:hypothetical protein [Candidatus Electrothrix sp. AUS4]